MIDPRMLGSALSPRNEVAPVGSVRPASAGMVPNLEQINHNSRPTGPVGAVSYGSGAGPWDSDEMGRWQTGFNPGQQVPTMQFTPVNDSAQRSSGGSGDFNALHLAMMSDALGQANFGNAPRMNLMDIFEDKGSGTFGLKTAPGTDVPVGVAGVDMSIGLPGGGAQTYQDAGYSPDRMAQFIARQLATIDESR